MTLRAVEKPVSLDEWEPFEDGESAEAAVRRALEDGLARGDRVVVYWMGENPDKTVTTGACNIQRRSKRLHWLAMFGGLTEWLQRWAHNDFH